MWFDANRDGVQNEAMAAGANGATVKLTKQGGSAVTDASGAVVAAVVSANDGVGNPGYYKFTNLLPGQYKVLFSTLPTGYSATLSDTERQCRAVGGLGS